MFKNFFAKKTPMPITNKIIQIVDEPLPEIIFESDSIVAISENGVLDTNSPESISKYKNNLRLLVKEAKSKGTINGFKIIRDDDFFPFDWEWIVGSKNTSIEKVCTLFSYDLRMEMAFMLINKDKNLPFHVPVPQEKINEAIAQLDPDIGLIFKPVRFRSTKHFTVNTPLGYTGDYNQVTDNRNFTIIDDADNFFNSGYTYSLAYQDAYLDITHEPLKISEKAVVLIAYDKYPELIKNPKIAQSLQERRVIVYKGDEEVAINMILSELGILPSKPGGRYIEYDNDTFKILENSIKEAAQKYGIDYNISHANNTGNGHFSDTYDGLNQDHIMYEKKFLDFLCSKLPQFKDRLTGSFLQDTIRINELIKNVGLEEILNIINEYNILMQREFMINYQNYKKDRKNIAPDVSNLFKRTIQSIKEYHKKIYEYPYDKQNQLRDLILQFYHADTVEEQKSAALTILKIFDETIEIKESTETR